MTVREFWGLYREKYMQYMGHEYCIIGCPVGKDHGTMEFGIFRDQNDNWCVEITKKGQDRGARNTFDLEEDAVAFLVRELDSHLPIG